MNINEDRKNRALTALDGYIVEGDNNLDSSIIDLLTDLQHLVGPHIFDHALNSAKLHYGAEGRWQAAHRGEQGRDSNGEAFDL